MNSSWGRKPLSFASIAGGSSAATTPSNATAAPLGEYREEEDVERDDDEGPPASETKTGGTKTKVPPPSILKKTQQLQAARDAIKPTTEEDLEGDDDDENLDDEEDDEDDEDEDDEDDREGRAYENPGNVPSRVASYIRDLHRRMMASEVGQVRYLYYKAFKEVTKAYYLDSEWPSVEEVAALCEGNQFFLLCYRELATRHIFMHGQPQLHHRFESWTNYRALFDFFLELGAREEGGAGGEGQQQQQLYLPLEWLNDMVDEFLYQFQDYHAFKFSGGKSQAEIEVIQNNPNVWRAHTVLAYLVAFAERAGLAGGRTGTSSSKSTAAPQQQQQQQLAHHHHHHHHIPILKAMGAFSLVGLARLHNSLCDYRTALRVVDAVDLDNQREFVQTHASALTLYYNLGFAYLMSRRYADAVAICSRVLVSHRVNKEVFSSYAEDLIQNKYEKIVVLTSITAALSPGVRLDDQVRRQIAERHEKFAGALASPSAEEVFEEAFLFVCPKFVNPAPGLSATPESAARAAKEPLRIQLRWFLQDVRQQASLPTVRSFLKLYKSIPIEKLAAFCGGVGGKEEENEASAVDSIRQSLVFIKARGTQLVRAADGTPASRGSRATVSDVHFYVAPGSDQPPLRVHRGGDMVHIVASGEVAASVRSQHFSRYFVSQTLKLHNVVDDGGDRPTSTSTTTAQAAVAVPGGASA